MKKSKLKPQRETSFLQRVMLQKLQCMI